MSALQDYVGVKDGKKELCRWKAFLILRQCLLGLNCLGSSLKYFPKGLVGNMVAMAAIL